MSSYNQLTSILNQNADILSNILNNIEPQIINNIETNNSLMTDILDNFTPGLENSGVTPGQYNYASIVVNSLGKITGASSNYDNGSLSFNTEGSTFYLNSSNLVMSDSNNVNVNISTSGVVISDINNTTGIYPTGLTSVDNSNTVSVTPNSLTLEDNAGNNTLVSAGGIITTNVTDNSNKYINIINNDPSITINDADNNNTVINQVGLTTQDNQSNVTTISPTGLNIGDTYNNNINISSTNISITNNGSDSVINLVGDTIGNLYNNHKIIPCGTTTPTATIGSVPKRGIATTYMTSDSAPALEKTGVTAGTYNYARITVDATGRIINASGNTISSVVPKYTPTATIGAAVKIGTATTYMTSDSAPALEQTGVTAGTYNYASITVDATGRIINASENTIDSSTPTATIGSTVKIGTATTYMTSDSAPALEQTGVTAGTYNYARITVDATGRIINASSLTASARSNRPTATIGATVKIGTATTYMTSDSAPALEQTGVTAGTYNYARITVDATGRIINASGNTIGSSTPTATIGATVKIGTATTYMTSDSAPALEQTGVTAGTYNYAKITVDATGRIIGASSLITPATIGRTPTATIGATVKIGTSTTYMTSDSAPALEKTGVTSGTYNYATITVDATGRILNAISNTNSTGNSNPPTATIGADAKIGTATTFMTSDSAPALEKTGVTAGTYNYAKITVDATGRITGATNSTGGLNINSLGSSAYYGSSALQIVNSTQMATISAIGTFLLDNNTTSYSTFTSEGLTITDANGNGSFLRGSNLILSDENNNTTTIKYNNLIIQDNQSLNATTISQTGLLTKDSSNNSINISSTNISITNNGSTSVINLVGDTVGNLYNNGNIIPCGTTTPTATIGAVPKTGTATTYMTSDSAPALEQTGVTADTYNYASITVDATGRITGASSNYTNGSLYFTTPGNTTILNSLGLNINNSNNNNLNISTTAFTFNNTETLDTLNMNQSSIFLGNTFKDNTIISASTLKMNDINNNSMNLLSTSLNYTDSTNNNMLDISSTGLSIKTINNNNINTFASNLSSDGISLSDSSNNAINIIPTNITIINGSSENSVDLVCDINGNLNSNGNIVPSGTKIPTATIGAQAILGTATTYMTSDSAPALELTGVTSGTYNYATITVDATGRILNASGNTIGSSTPTATIGATVKIGTATTYMTSDSAPALELTGVTAGTYNYAKITVDATGRIIGASSLITPATIGRTPTATIGATVKIGTATTYMTSDSAPALEKTGVTSGTYNYATITVDATGRILNAISNTNSTGNSNPPTATIGADAKIGTATTFMTSDSAPALEQTGVIPGTYIYSSITVDATGRIIGATNNRSTLYINSAGSTAFYGSSALQINTDSSSTIISSRGLNTRDNNSNSTIISSRGLNSSDNNSNTIIISSTGLDSSDNNLNNINIIPSLLKIKDSSNNYITISSTEYNAVDNHLNSTTISSTGLNTTDNNSNNISILPNKIQINSNNKSVELTCGNDGNLYSNGNIVSYGTNNSTLSSLQPTGVTAGTYNYPSITVDETGRITGASSNYNNDSLSFNTEGSTFYLNSNNLVMSDSNNINVNISTTGVVIGDLNETTGIYQTGLSSVDNSNNSVSVAPNSLTLKDTDGNNTSVSAGGIVTTNYINSNKYINIINNDPSITINDENSNTVINQSGLTIQDNIESNITTLLSTGLNIGDTYNNNINISSTNIVLTDRFANSVSLSVNTDGDLRNNTNNKIFAYKGHKYYAYINVFNTSGYTINFNSSIGQFVNISDSNDSVIYNIETVSKTRYGNNSYDNFSINSNSGLITYNGTENIQLLINSIFSIESNDTVNNNNIQINLYINGTIQNASAQFMKLPKQGNSIQMYNQYIIESLKQNDTFQYLIANLTNDSSVTLYSSSISISNLSYN